MSISERLLNSITASNVAAEDVFADAKTGDVCRAFYAINGAKKRRLLVCVAEEYEEDVLATESGFNQAFAVLRKHLVELNENVNNQKNEFEREEDFRFS